MSRFRNAIRLCILLVAFSLIQPLAGLADEGFDADFLAAIDESLSKTKDEKKDDTAKKHKSVDKKQRTVASYVAYQTAGSHVSTQCFPPRLRAVLTKIRKHYGKKPIVNSGFRSASQNRRVGGARKSYHVKCMAADIRVPGVSKYQLARYVKKIPGVGGVGTYACKSFIHVDIGPKRDWHWRCRSKRGRRA